MSQAHADCPHCRQDGSEAKHIALKEVRIALAGNPNCGKTTAFNEYTGTHQHVGNYPGVTVDKKEGYVSIDGVEVLMVDLPGTYSLTAYSQEEILTRAVLAPEKAEEKPMAVVDLVDTSALERNLFLTVQIMEMGLPVVLACNMMDEARKAGIQVNTKELGKQLKKLGMLIVQDQIWGRVTANRSQGKATWYFADEFHLLLKEEQTAAYSAEIWKRFRKWGGIPTGATQNVKDLLSSPEIENILENSDFIYMLNQAAGDRKILADRLNISSEQLAYVTNSEPGHGLLFFNNVILPFADDFPKDTELYKLLTTKPSEVAHETVDDEKEDQNG